MRYKDLSSGICYQKPLFYIMFIEFNVMYKPERCFIVT